MRSFLASQRTSGPTMLPSGNAKPTNASRCASIAIVALVLRNGLGRKCRRDRRRTHEGRRWRSRRGDGGGARGRRPAVATDLDGDRSARRTRRAATGNPLQDVHGTPPQRAGDPSADADEAVVDLRRASFGAWPLPEDDERQRNAGVDQQWQQREGRDHEIGDGAEHDRNRAEDRAEGDAEHAEDHAEEEHAERDREGDHEDREKHREESGECAHGSSSCPRGASRRISRRASPRCTRVGGSLPPRRRRADRRRRGRRPRLRCAPDR